jgi:hypothetical protein
MAETFLYESTPGVFLEIKKDKHHMKNTRVLNRAEFLRLLAGKKWRQDENGYVWLEKKTAKSAAATRH